MNKEFAYASNKEVVVTDENGHMKKRPARNEMRDILVSEDKLEDLNTHINCLKTGIKIERKSIELINKWYKVMLGVTIGVAVLAPLTSGLLSGLAIFGGWTLAAVASCAYGYHTQKDSLKRINGYKNEIKKAREIEQEVKNDLEIDKALDKDFEVSNELVGKIIEIDSMKDFELQDRRLNRAFKQGYKEEPKVLVKSRKN